MLGTAAALPLGAPFIRHARAAEFMFKAATGLLPDHPTNVRLIEAAAAIAHDSNGRLEIRVFPSSQLGGEADLLHQVQSGAVEIFPIGGFVISAVVPMAALDGVGFAFKSYDQVWPAMDGELGGFIRAAIMEGAPLYVTRTIWDLGFRQITNSVRPINTLADLQGMKIRVPSAAAYIELFKALGASPVDM
jgi:TRAP-type C4-dicarboxylate transport system substrate-binding protein